MDAVRNEQHPLFLFAVGVHFLNGKAADRYSLSGRGIDLIEPITMYRVGTVVFCHADIRIEVYIRSGKRRREAAVFGFAYYIRNAYFCPSGGELSPDVFVVVHRFVMDELHILYADYAPVHCERKEYCAQNAVQRTELRAEELEEEQSTCEEQQEKRNIC